MLTLYTIFNTTTGSLFTTELYGKEYAEQLCEHLNYLEANQYVVLPVELSGELAISFEYLANYVPGRD